MWRRGNAREISTRDILTALCLKLTMPGLQVIPTSADHFPPATWPPVEQCAVGCVRCRMMGRSGRQPPDRDFRWCRSNGWQAVRRQTSKDARPGRSSGTVSGLEDEMNAIGHAHIVGAVPTGPVELQHDALFAPGGDRLGKIGKDESEHLFANGVGDVPHGLAGRRLDEPGHIEPSKR